MQNRKETQMYRTDFWTMWEKATVGCFKRTASKHVYYLGWNRSPAQVGCMRQVLGPGALGRARGIGRSGRWEGGSGWGIHVYPWLIHVNVWQKPLQYCKVISLQLIKINEKQTNKQANKQKEPVCQCRRHKRHGFDSWVGKIPWRGYATHSSTVAWRIPWIEEPGGLQCIKLQRVKHSWSDWTCMHIFCINFFMKL